MSVRRQEAGEKGRTPTYVCAKLAGARALESPKSPSLTQWFSSRNTVRRQYTERRGGVARRTVIGLQVPVQYLRPPPLLRIRIRIPVLAVPAAPAAAHPPMHRRVVAVVEREEDLHEVRPDGVLGDGPAVALRLLDDGGEVAVAAVLHEDVHDAGVAVDEAVVVADDVLVVEVFEDVPVVCVRFASRLHGEEERREGSVSVQRWKGVRGNGHAEGAYTHTSETMSFLSRSDMRSNLSSFLANIWTACRVSACAWRADERSTVDECAPCHRISAGLS